MGRLSASWRYKATWIASFAPALWPKIAKGRSSLNKISSPIARAIGGKLRKGSSLRRVSLPGSWIAAISILCGLAEAQLAKVLAPPPA
jgi:hypothetical protein